MHVDLPSLLQLMQFEHLSQMDVNRAFRSVDTPLIAFSLVVQGESDVFVKNLLKFAVFRIHYTSAAVVVQFNNLL